MNAIRRLAPDRGRLVVRDHPRRNLPMLSALLLTLLIHAFVPVGACWMAGLAASDPLLAGSICSSGGDHDPVRPDGSHQGHDCCYSACCPAHAAALDGPEPNLFATPRRAGERIVWVGTSFDDDGWSFRSHPQARAPPAHS